LSCLRVYQVRLASVRGRARGGERARDGNKKEGYQEERDEEKTLCEEEVIPYKRGRRSKTHVPAFGDPSG
jgi:hypothetical protein